MTQEEVNGLLGQPYLTVRREEEPNTLRIVRHLSDTWEIIENDIGLSQAGNDKVAMGQFYQLWNRKEGGILVIFSEDGTLLDKEYRRKKSSFWQRLLNLLW